MSRGGKERKGKLLFRLFSAPESSSTVSGHVRDCSDKVSSQSKQNNSDVHSANFRTAFSIKPLHKWYTKIEQFLPPPPPSFHYILLHLVTRSHLAVLWVEALPAVPRKFMPAKQHYPSLFLIHGPKQLSNSGTKAMPLSWFHKVLATLVLVWASFVDFNFCAN